MNKIFVSILAVSLLAVNADAKKIKFDYSVVNVPEEGGVNFEGSLMIQIAYFIP